jgi:hypothetical protein
MCGACGAISKPAKRTRSRIHAGWLIGTYVSSRIKKTGVKKTGAHHFLAGATGRSKGKASRPNAAAVVIRSAIGNQVRRLGNFSFPQILARLSHRSNTLAAYRH